MSSPSLTPEVCLPLRLVATALCPELQVLTDEVVTLRPPRPGDAHVLGGCRGVVGERLSPTAGNCARASERLRCEPTAAGKRSARRAGCKPPGRPHCAHHPLR